MELQWFRDYLSNHHQSVVYDKHCSNPLPVSCGVPQGFLLGALLFLIHFNDVEDCLMNSEAVMYADDTVIFFSDKDINLINSKLSEDMTYLSQWLDANELFINLKKGKTECMLFGTAKRLSTLKDQQLSVNFKDSAVCLSVSLNDFSFALVF